jgi:peroxiredoxin
MTMLDTFELGPYLNAHVPDFLLSNHEHRKQGLKDLMGTKGVLLGFIGDIWMPTSVRRIFWLQRHAPKFASSGAPVALLVRDNAHTLYGFRMSSPLPVPFPLLADVNGEVHRQNNMERHPGLVLLDRNFTVRAKWLVPDERVWPAMQTLLEEIERIPG